MRELLEPELLSLLELELRLGMLDLRGCPEPGPDLEAGAWGRRHGRELSTGDTDLKYTGDISQCEELGDEQSSIVQEIRLVTPAVTQPAHTGCPLQLMEQPRSQFFSEPLYLWS